MYLKSATILIFKYFPKRNDLGLSNELLLIIIAQGATKLCPAKLRGLKNILAQVESNPFLISKRETHKAIFSDLHLCNISFAVA